MVRPNLRLLAIHALSTTDPTHWCRQSPILHHWRCLGSLPLSLQLSISLKTVSQGRLTVSFLNCLFWFLFYGFHFWFRVSICGLGFRFSIFLNGLFWGIYFMGFWYFVVFLARTKQPLSKSHSDLSQSPSVVFKNYEIFQISSLK